MDDAGACCSLLVIVRRSCVWEKWWIKDPAQINNKALKRACAIRWKKARFGSPRPKVDSITPSWLRVDRAIIFLRSHSTRADRPAINMVSEATRRREG